MGTPPQRHGPDAAPQGLARTTIDVLAFGDVLLAPAAPPLPLAATQESRLRSLRARLAPADVVFANLETTLAGTEGCIPKEPRVIARSDHMARALAALRPSLVSLANNHAFDCYATGFAAVAELLEAQGIQAFGAGSNAKQAAAPLSISASGIRLGWLGYTTADTSPSHVAAAAGFGVNLFDVERARREISRLRADVDHVIVSLHWGVEYCPLPSPDQIAWGRSLIDAGATVVIGHHAHVIQGVETYRGGLIAYGLGNAVTTDLRIGGRLAIKQSRRTHSALALRFTLSAIRLIDVETIPYRMSGEHARVRDVHAERLLARANEALAEGITPPRWRRRRFLEDVVLRPLWKLDPRVIRSLSWAHAKQFSHNLARSLRTGATRPAPPRAPQS